MSGNDRDRLSDSEIAYLESQRLGRLATVDSDCGPQNNPVSCYYNPATQTIDIGGHAMKRSRKYGNVQRNPRVALVIDDMPAGPASSRYLEIRGTAEAIAEPNDSAARLAGPIIRIRPRRIISWGVGQPET